MINIIHIIAIVIVAIITYLARYIPLKHGEKLTHSNEISRILRSCTIAIITSLIIISILPTYEKLEISKAIPLTISILAIVLTSRKINNIGILTIIGFIIYTLIRILLELEISISS